ncbi:MAG TPA: hypothetical protein VHC69_26140 [Polyangiaceae bacterium]|nr:hypothetical protein [Polyangiaceae bacterium]
MANRETPGTGPWTAHVLERIHEVEAGVDPMIEWASRLAPTSRLSTCYYVRTERC